MAKKKPVVKKKVKKSDASIINTVYPRTKQDRLWQAESDARTLAQAEDIKKSTIRLKAAKVQAKRMATQQELELSFIKKIANSK